MGWLSWLNHDGDGDEWLEHPGSVGRAAETEFRVLDEDGAALPDGEVGELFMRRSDTDVPSFQISARRPWALAKVPSSARMVRVPMVWLLRRLCV